MNKENWFSKTLGDIQDDAEFLTERAIIDFTEKVSVAMQEAGMSRAELARHLGVSKAFITKLLNGNPNLTIRTMVSLAKALGCSLDLNLYPRELQVRTVCTRTTTPWNEGEYTEMCPVVFGGDFNAVAA